MTEVHNDWCSPEICSEVSLQNQIDDINKRLEIILIAVGLVKKKTGFRTHGLSPDDQSYEEVLLDSKTISQMEWEQYIESLKKKAHREVTWRYVSGDEECTQAAISNHKTGELYHHSIAKSDDE
jgi:hypothetical protein